MLQNKDRPAGVISVFIVHSGGTTTIEYALIVSGIAMAIAGLVAVFGTELVALFTVIHDQFAGINGV